MKSGDDGDPVAARVDQMDRLPADALRQRNRWRPGLVRQSQQVGFVIGAEGEAGEPVGPPTTSRRARSSSAPFAGTSPGA